MQKISCYIESLLLSTDTYTCKDVVTTCRVLVYCIHFNQITFIFLQRL